jgi:hypothetical protein
MEGHGEDATKAHVRVLGGRGVLGVRATRFQRTE